MSAEQVPTVIAASILNVHPETLRNWSRRGMYELPEPTQVGSRLRWDPAELYAWMERRKRRRVAT